MVIYLDLAWIVAVGSLVYSVIAAIREAIARRAADRFVFPPQRVIEVVIGDRVPF